MALFKYLADKNNPDARSSISVMFEDDFSTVVVDSSHEAYHEVLRILNDVDMDTEEQESALRKSMQSFVAIGERLRSLSDRVTYNEGHVFYDHEPIDDELAGMIKALVKEEDDKKLRSLVNFLEKLYASASLTARRSLFKWVSDRQLTIYPDGDFLAYKGVQVNEDGVSESIHKGDAFVDNVRYSGHIPNPLNAVVSMPRSEVEENEYVPCGVGLHVGSWDYALGWGRGRTLKVKVNPADVISVPNDSYTQKMRTCRYLVLEETDQPINEYVVDDEEEYEEEYEGEEYCDSCGEQINLLEYYEYGDDGIMCESCSLDSADSADSADSLDEDSWTTVDIVDVVRFDD